MNPPAPSPSPRPSRWLRAITSRLRIRQKLILLHTMFSIALAAILLLSIRPAVRDIVASSEARRTELAARLALLESPSENSDALELRDVELRRGSAADLLLPTAVAQQARATPGQIVMSQTEGGWPLAIVWDPSRSEFLVVSPRSPAARQAVLNLYKLIGLALLAVYGLIALTMEVFVLPQHVYAPIRRLQEADEAARQGRRDEELIPEDETPADELGQIMRSRNAVIRRFRQQEQELAKALEELERIASDLKVKNHLLEQAKRNLPDQDRLAALGMMSAGVAHELNTPLAVLKGVAEELANSPTTSLPPQRAQLMLRVVRRLERLGTNLLDFARAGPSRADAVNVASLLDEAWTLATIDRNPLHASLRSRIDPALTIAGDEDRLVHALVNLLRNALDATEGHGLIDVAAHPTSDGQWISLTVADNGPGVDPELLPQLFEPFVTSKLDAKGTGLGLAVVESVVRAHNGVIVARNRPTGGAEFKILLPAFDVNAAAGHPKAPCAAASSAAVADERKAS
ncbi:MAG: sensor histidine kinase [Planctomycetota bacterium]|nr:MAG: sensor histidine kinase [Planctomycetota bacterium]